MKNRLYSLINIELSNIIYAIIIFILSITFIYQSNNDNIISMAAIILVWSLYFIFLRIKKHTLNAISSSILFWLYAISDIINYDVNQISLIAYSFFTIGLSFLYISLQQTINHRVKNHLLVTAISVSIILYLIPITYIAYYMKFGVYMTPEIIYAILQTNISEVIEFIDVNIYSKWLFSVLIIPAAFSYYIYKINKSTPLTINTTILIALILVSFAISLDDKKNLRVIYMLTRTVSHYGEELEKFKKIQEKRDAGEIQFSATKNQTAETYIVVIGESLNKNHMSLYGYMRKTTPQLQKIKSNNELIVFNNAYSSHTHTMPVLSQLLTEANQKNNKNYYDSLSIIDILNKANIHTYWITNQVIKGDNDNLVGVIATQADHLYRINHEFGASSKTRNYDGEIIKITEDILRKKDNKNKVLFVHLMGSHWDYCSRFPSIFNKYTETLSPSLFGNISKNNEISRPVNCYDNSILYNDYVISSLINKLSLENKVSSLVYISDHGDDVLKMLGHNSGKFTFNMTEIPLLMWFSPSYKIKYYNKINNLVSHKNELFSNDLMYDTFVGLMNINTKNYEYKNDLSNKDYKLSTEKAYTLHGKIQYTDKKNTNYWLQNNSNKLLQKKLTSKILPHRVNSIGKLNQVLNNKLRSLELDLSFISSPSGDYFIVGHDNGTQSNITLDEYLKSLPINDMKKMWFDIKNINDKNMDDVRKRLNHLNHIYNLKNKVIIESGTTSSSFSKISNNGYHTSYYLPGNLATLYRKNKHDELNNATKDLLLQLATQNCSAISFDISLYPYVKDFLDKKLDKKMVFHTWDLSLELKNNNFVDEIHSKDYFNDDRVKTILVTYYSEFNL